MIRLKAESVCNRIGVEKFSETHLVKCLARLLLVNAEGPWIAGGAVRKTLQCAPLDSDFDFFFANESQAEQFHADMTDLGAQVVSKTQKNSTYMLPAKVPEGAEGKGVKLPELKVQAIKFQYYVSPEHVIDSFDFTLSQFAYDGSDLIVSEFALWDVARMRLVPHRITFGASSVRRMLKYANQGFAVCAGAISEVLKQVADNPDIIHSDTLYID